MALVTHLNIRDGEITPSKLNTGENYTVSGLSATYINIGSQVSQSTAQGARLYIKETAQSASATIESTVSNGDAGLKLKNDNSTWITKASGTASDSYIVQQGENGTGYFAISCSGTFGFNTVQPDINYRAHFDNTGTMNMLLQNSTDNVSIGLEVNSSSGTIGTVSNSSFGIKTNDVTTTTIDTSGNLTQTGYLKSSGNVASASTTPTLIICNTSTTHTAGNLGSIAWETDDTSVTTCSRLAEIVLTTNTPTTDTDAIACFVFNGRCTGATDNVQFAILNPSGIYTCRAICALQCITSATCIVTPCMVVSTSLTTPTLTATGNICAGQCLCAVGDIVSGTGISATTSVAAGTYMSATTYITAGANICSAQCLCAGGNIVGGGSICSLATGTNKNCFAGCIISGQIETSASVVATGDLKGANVCSTGNTYAVAAMCAGTFVYATTCLKSPTVCATSSIITPSFTADAGVLATNIQPSFINICSACSTAGSVASCIAFKHCDAAGNVDQFATIYSCVRGSTSTGECGMLKFQVISAGSLADRLILFENSVCVPSGCLFSAGVGCFSTCLVTPIYYAGCICSTSGINATSGTINGCIVCALSCVTTPIVCAGCICIGGILTFCNCVNGPVGCFTSCVLTLCSFASACFQAPVVCASSCVVSPVGCFNLACLGNTCVCGALNVVALTTMNCNILMAQANYGILCMQDNSPLAAATNGQWLVLNCTSQAVGYMTFGSQNASNNCGCWGISLGNGAGSTNPDMLSGTSGILTAKTCICTPYCIVAGTGICSVGIFTAGGVIHSATCISSPYLCASTQLTAAVVCASSCLYSPCLFTANISDPSQPLTVDHNLQGSMILTDTVSSCCCWEHVDWGATLSVRGFGASNSMCNSSHMSAPLEVVSCGCAAASFIAFHVPNLWGGSFGLDTDCQFSTQGWSAGQGGWTGMKVGNLRVNGNACATGCVCAGGIISATDYICSTCGLYSGQFIMACSNICSAACLCAVGTVCAGAAIFTLGSVCAVGSFMCSNTAMYAPCIAASACMCVGVAPVNANHVAPKCYVDAVAGGSASIQHLEFTHGGGTCSYCTQAITQVTCSTAYVVNSYTGGSCCIESYNFSKMNGSVMTKLQCAGCCIVSCWTANEFQAKVNVEIIEW